MMLSQLIQQHVIVLSSWLARQIRNTPPGPATTNPPPPGLAEQALDRRSAVMFDCTSMVEYGSRDVTHLAVNRKMSESTPNQALNATSFMHRAQQLNKNEKSALVRRGSRSEQRGSK